MATIIKGKDFTVELANRGTIACSRSCELSIDVDTTEISSPDSGSWKDYIAGRKGWQMTTSHLVSTSNFSLFKSLVGTKVGVSFTDGEHSLSVWGYAICTGVKITATLGNLCQGSFTFTGCGALT